MNDAAATQPMAMLAAAMVFAGAVAVLLFSAEEEGDAQAQDAPQVRAADLGRLLVDGYGLESIGGVPSKWECDDDPLILLRYGLRDALAPGSTIDPCKVRYMQEGNITYTEVAKGLGVPETHGIHLRFQPVLDDLRTMQARGRLALDVAYINSSIDPGVAVGEIDALRNVTNKVTTYNSTGWPGMDTCDHAVCENLTAGNFDVLVVGSDVDHDALLDVMGDGLGTWVLWQDGLLVVLPSAFADTPWLIDLWNQANMYGQGSTMNNEPLRGPDPGHPMLHVPNRLGWQTYSTLDDLDPLVTYFDSASASVLRPVGDPDAPVAHIPSQRAFGGGGLILVHVNATAPAGAPYTEGHKLVHNILVRHQEELWLEFGIGAPEQEATSSTVRWSQLPATDFYTGQAGTVGIRAQVHLFPTTCPAAVC